MLTSVIIYVIVNEQRAEVFFFCSKIRKDHIFLNKVEVKLMRTRITLECTECKQRNYDTTKDKKTHPDRVETNKYCKFCRKHTLHKETK